MSEDEYLDQASDDDSMTPRERQLLDRLAVIRQKLVAKCRQAVALGVPLSEIEEDMLGLVPESEDTEYREVCQVFISASSNR